MITFEWAVQRSPNLKPPFSGDVWEPRYLVDDVDGVRKWMTSRELVELSGAVKVHAIAWRL